MLVSVRDVQVRLKASDGVPVILKPTVDLAASQGQDGDGSARPLVHRRLFETEARSCCGPSTPTHTRLGIVCATVFARGIPYASVCPCKGTTEQDVSTRGTYPTTTRGRLKQV